MDKSPQKRIRQEEVRIPPAYEQKGSSTGRRGVDRATFSDSTEWFLRGKKDREGFARDEFTGPPPKHPPISPYYK